MFGRVCGWPDWLRRQEERVSVVVVMMGVSGAGKTTIGRLVAERLQWPFYDGDDFHPAANVAKMASGEPLNDEDRGPWLARLRDLIEAHLEEDEAAIIAASALKKAYRETLRVGDPRVRFVFLEGDFDLIWARMARRPDHYMKAEMLRSQFAALEVPREEEALAVDVERSAEAVADEVVAWLGREGIA